MTTDLIKITITPKDVFVPGGLDPILKAVDSEIEKFNLENVLDMDKKKDRDILRSFSAQIPRSKTFVDDKRKSFVKDKKSELKIIDTECKIFRDAMDKRKTETRKPLTDWEEAEKKRVEEERQLEIYLMEWDDALAEDDIFNRERELKAKEAEMERIEEEKRQKEESERLEKERIENEARIKKEAAEKAEREAEEKIKFEREERERVEREAGEAKEQAERDRIAAENQAEIDKEAAVQKAKDEAAQKEKERQYLADLESQRKREEAQHKADNKRHQAHVNNKVKNALMSCVGLDSETAENVIKETVKGNVPFLSVNY